jgi:peptide/nickel transport system ATP-binding protein
LDVTIQAQILDLLGDLQQRIGSTVLLITHDLGVVAETCDRVGVMYAGQLVEVASAQELFDSPQHPYTQALLAAIPTKSNRTGRLKVIEGSVPDLAVPPPGCRFADRCVHRLGRCDQVPELVGHSERAVACWWASGHE